MTCKKGFFSSLGFHGKRRARCYHFNGQAGSKINPDNQTKKITGLINNPGSLPISPVLYIPGHFIYV
jgi:hypothetical protein